MPLKTFPCPAGCGETVQLDPEKHHGTRQNLHRFDPTARCYGFIGFIDGQPVIHQTRRLFEEWEEQVTRNTKLDQ